MRGVARWRKLEGLQGSGSQDRGAAWQVGVKTLCPFINGCGVSLFEVRTMCTQTSIFDQTRFRKLNCATALILKEQSWSLYCRSTVASSLGPTCRSTQPSTQGRSRGYVHSGLRSKRNSFSREGTVFKTLGDSIYALVELFLCCSCITVYGLPVGPRPTCLIFSIKKLRS